MGVLIAVREALGSRPGRSARGLLIISLAGTFFWFHSMVPALAQRRTFKGFAATIDSHGASRRGDRVPGRRHPLRPALLLGSPARPWQVGLVHISFRCHRGERLQTVGPKPAGKSSVTREFGKQRSEFISTDAHESPRSRALSYDRRRAAPLAAYLYEYLLVATEP
jgi:hypothetical protein